VSSGLQSDCCTYCVDQLTDALNPKLSLAATILSRSSPLSGK